MQGCLLYKIVDRQDKCDKVGNQGPEGSADHRLKDWQKSAGSTKYGACWQLDLQAARTRRGGNSERRTAAARNQRQGDSEVCK